MKNTSMKSALSTRPLSLDLKHVRCAVIAADHGSFRQAAEALFVRQSTLSRYIGQLEHSIGVALFERSSGGARTTTYGRDFLRAAKSIIEQLDSLALLAQLNGQRENGRLVIGFYTSLSTGHLRATIADYTKRFPDVRIEMLESTRSGLETALRSNLVDIAVVTGERGLPGSCSLPLWTERLLVVLPETHKLAENTVVYWTDLKDDTILLGRRDPGPAIQELLNAKMPSAEDRPKVISYDISRESIKSLVGASFGLGITLEASLGASFDSVVHRELCDSSGPTRIGLSANWLESNESPSLTNFLRLLRERYPSPHSKSLRR